MIDWLVEHRLWIAVLMLADAGVTLALHERIGQPFRGWNVRRVAMVEGVCAMAIAAVHFSAQWLAGGMP
jgi:hypothetical protein